MLSWDSAVGLRRDEVSGGYAVGGQRARWHALRRLVANGCRAGTLVETLEHGPKITQIKAELLVV